MLASRWPLSAAEHLPPKRRTADHARPAALNCFVQFPAKETEIMNPVTIHGEHSARNPVAPVTLGDLMRRRGPEWAARCIQRRYGIRRRHAALVAAMLGCD
jgi:hypothetical protein